MINAKKIRRKLYQYVVDELGLRIIRGVYLPGGTLHNEDTLCGELGVSRGVLREATKVLIQKGLIESRPRTGTVICPRDSWNLFDPDVLIWKSEIENNAEFLRNIMEVRRIIESEAARLAAERGKPEDIERIRSIYEEIATAIANQPPDAVESILVLDVQFHTAILEACGNELIAQIGHTMRLALLAARHIDAPDLEAHKASRSPHLKILNAITNHNADQAYRLSLQHINQVWREMQGKLRPKETRRQARGLRGNPNEHWK
jgi:DNA-binding FadR family transcriptional regulator